MIPRIDDEIWHKHAWQNRLQSALLILLMFGLCTYLGNVVAGRSGVISSILSILVLVIINPSFSPKWIMRLYQCSPLLEHESPKLKQLIRILSQRAGLEQVPTLYYLPSEQLHAFAAGSRGRSAIALSDGILRNMDLRELAGILGHEISHIRNNDLWVMGLADLFSRITNMFSLLGLMMVLSFIPLTIFSEEEVTFNWFALMLLIFAPHLTALAQLALSRTREFNADLNSARLTGDPDGLANALAKIERIQGNWVGRLLFPGRKIPDLSILRTHPDTNERVSRLRQLNANHSVKDFFHPFH